MLTHLSVCLFVRLSMARLVQFESLIFCRTIAIFLKDPLTHYCSIPDFLNFTLEKDNKTKNSLQNDQLEVDPKTLLRFFKEFDTLVAEILKDIADYIGAVAKSSPTQANIEKLKEVTRTLSSLKRTSRHGAVEAHESDTEDLEEIKKRSFWSSVLKGALGVAKVVVPALLNNDEDKPAVAGDVMGEFCFATSGRF